MEKNKGLINTIKRVLLYFNDKYDMLQKDEIIQGKNKNLDISYYNNRDFNWEQMREIRLGLEKGLDVNSYSKSEFKVDQMEEIRLGLEKGLDVSYYNKTNFDWKQMRDIRIGLEKGLDVSAYAKEELNIDQMEEIRLGLEKELDVSYYSKHSFNWEQMREIRLGLQRGVDVSTYAKSSLSIKQMEKARLKLQKENSSVDRGHSFNKKLENKQALGEKTDVVKEKKAKEKQVVNDAVSSKKEEDFSFSRYDANVIFPIVKRTPNKKAIEERLDQKYHNKNEAERQKKIFNGRIKKLVKHGYMEEENSDYSITLKGAKAAKEINKSFEFTSYDANVIFGYINSSNGFLTLDSLKDKLKNKYTNSEDIEKQFSYIENRLENNLKCGYLTKNQSGAYSISEIGAMKAEEINSSLELSGEISQEIEL